MAFWESVPALHEYGKVLDIVVSQEGPLPAFSKFALRTLAASCQGMSAMGFVI